MKKKTARDWWTALKSDRKKLEEMWERSAAVTLPYLYTPDNTDADRDGASLEWQAVGAQLVNHLSTRMMLTLFAPSRPFIRLEASPQILAEALSTGTKPEELQAALAEGERNVVKHMDSLAMRPSLFESTKHLIVLGNLMLYEDRERKRMRPISVKHYCVKRTLAGEVHTVVKRECVKRDELPEDWYRDLPRQRTLLGQAPDTMVEHFVLIQRQGRNRWKVTEWVDDDLIPGSERTYTDLTLPYHIITWTLPDEADYGIGLVGEYIGHFNSLSMLSRAQIETAVMISEYRWLLSPNAAMRPESLKESVNGDVIAGEKDDAVLLSLAADLAPGLQQQMALHAELVNSLGRAFLLNSAATRDAERVTAEEIRLLAQELETGLGGAYSRLASDLQLPVARFLMRDLRVDIGPNGYKPIIITGLDALSRGGDLTALITFIDYVTKLSALPEYIADRLEIQTILIALGTKLGVESPSSYVSSEEAFNQRQNLRAQREAAASAAAAAGQAASTGDQSA